MALSKHDQSRPTLLVSGGAERIKSRISEENSGHIIERLTKLYRNAAEAAIRETCSNAVDATVALTESLRKPIEITSPSVFDPRFQVRDHGVGMSLETVAGVYVNYGSTTKGDELDAVGSHGLGGKSPLAYTDHFTVETTHEGVTTNFTMQRSGGDVETTINFSKETGNTSGTLVIIPVDTQDVDAFVTVIESYRSHSWVTPVIVDGEYCFGNREYETLGTVVIYKDEDTEITSPIRVRRDRMHTFFNNFRDHSFSVDLISYGLAGWLYSARGGDQINTNPMVVVDLVPAIVEFSSSRDSITSDKRLNELNVRVIEALTDNHDLVEEALRVFRDFSREELQRFDRGLHSEVFRFVDGRLFIGKRNSYSGGTAFRGDISLLDNKIGINPYTLGGIKDQNSINFGISMQEKGLRRTFISKNESLMGGALIEQEAGKITALNELYTAEDSESSLVETARTFFSNEKRMTVVTDVDINSFKSFIRARNALFTYSTEIGNKDEIFFFTPRERLPRTETKIATTLLGDRFKIVSGKDLTAKIAPIRKRLVITRKVADADAHDAEITTYRAFNTPDVVAWTHEELTKCTKLTNTKISYEEILRGDGVIFFSSSWKQVYYGAVNDGYDFTGKPIYVVSARMTASLAKSLSPYKNRIFFSPYFEIKHQTGRNLKTDRAFYGNVLNEDLKKITREQLLARLAVMESSDIDKEALSFIVNYVPEDSLEYNILSLITRYHEDTTLHSALTPESAVQEWGNRYEENDPELATAKRLRELYTSALRQDGVEGILHKNVLGRTFGKVKLRENQPAVQFVLKTFADKFTNGSTYASDVV